jgi:hypothetical protein
LLIAAGERSPLTLIPGHLDWIRLVRSRDEQINVPGDRGIVPSKAVTFRLKLSEPVLDERSCPSAETSQTGA